MQVVHNQGEATSIGSSRVVSQTGLNFTEALDKTEVMSVGCGKQPDNRMNELVYIAHRHGSANVPRIDDLCDVVLITHAFHLVTCPDATVRNIVANTLHDATEKRIGRAPSNQDIATFLSGSLDGKFGWDRHDIAMRRLQKRIGFRRGLLERTLKAAIYLLYIETLKHKPDQDKAFDLTSKWDTSNHFLAGGGFTRFANQQFIHHAQLNCILLNGAVRHENQDKRCRKCSYSNETLPHILCSCKPHSRAWQLRHKAIQNRLAKATAPRLGEISVNSTIPSTNSQLRPDDVVTDEAQKKIILVDITVSFENRTPAFCKARARKLEKYGPLANTLRAKGYEMQMDQSMLRTAHAAPQGLRHHPMVQGHLHRTHHWPPTVPGGVSQSDIVLRLRERDQETFSIHMNWNLKLPEH
ncbi:hypothetical protein KIL84_012097 [Mauremys mutica]|uniref:Reverse transcriptase n=1 Tax=Mauremys mutica TaxID=74926 RepID=A0A9D4B301_9SAUR|nr:hypothetical protein KIL84_012097 [Mauremys mutica]